MDLKGAHIFSAGVWNDQTFTEEDLDGIVAAFELTKMAGRVPLKFGHNDEQTVTDGQPALGWVSRIWRDGKALMADFTDLPGVIFDAIKKKLYNFVSIELLKDAEWSGVKYPNVLDAVALLGADKPAVSNLAELSALTLTRAASGLRFSARAAFTQAPFVTPTMGDAITMDQQAVQAAIRAELQPIQAELTEAKTNFTKVSTELAAEKKRATDAEAELATIRDNAKKDKIKANKERFTNLVEAAFKAKRIDGKGRETLTAKFAANDEQILAIDFDVVEMVTGKLESTQREDIRKVSSFSRHPDNTEDYADKDAVKRLVDAKVEDKISKGDKRDKFAITAEVLRLNPELGTAVHGLMLAGDRNAA